MGFSTPYPSRTRPISTSFHGDHICWPESRDGRGLHRRHGGRGICEVGAGELRAEIAALANAYARHDSDANLIALTTEAIAKLADSDMGAEQPGDARVARARDARLPSLEVT